MGKLKEMREQGAGGDEGAGEAGEELFIVQCPMPKCSILRLLSTYFDLPRQRLAQAAQYKSLKASRSVQTTAQCPITLNS
ncbi:MAG: hypothetical protein V7L20_30780 [Nostoc sp.]|uniref:hypothetical protein n=1 Tax=Nostoc sp. TaxID=1180 RepID=UPI002FF82D5F